GISGDYEYEHDGVPTYGSSAIVKGPAWTVLVQQDERSALVPVVSTWGTIATIVVLAAAAAVLTSLLLARDMSGPLSALADAAEAVEGGDYEVRVRAARLIEIDTLGHALNRMAEAVRDRETELLDSRNRLAAESEAKAAVIARLGAMSAELAAAEERERRHLAEELHDRVSQILAVARMRLGIARSFGEPDSEGLDGVDALLGEAIAESRAITGELASTALYELGLGPALAETCEKVTAQSGLTVECALPGDLECVPDDAKPILLRAAREMLANVVKHADTTSASLSVSLMDGCVLLTVADDGVGFDASEAADHEGFGLASLRERVVHIGGSLKV
ncbi:MAG: HAMP domain-containing protein, partial [Actinobacteria bacterium]